jgi:hypothetical protein
VTRIVQLTLTLAAGWGLWLLWRAAVKAHRGTAPIVTAGLLLRVLSATSLFWISFLGWPVADSLQRGQGFWFFALDGESYFAIAEQAAREGPHAVRGIDHPSGTFIQLLAVAVAAFGNVAAVAIPLNCAAYLGTCALAIRLAEYSSKASLMVSAAAIAFGPSAILWAAQPLKDTVVLFLMTAIFAALGVWQHSWMVRRSSPLRLTGAATAVVVGSYLLAGVRWYVPFVIWMAFPVFGLWLTWRVRRRIPALLGSAALFVVLGQAVEIGGRTAIPERFSRLLDFTQQQSASEAGAYASEVRAGFENTPGATEIRPGSSWPGRADSRQDSMIAGTFAKTVVGAIALTVPPSVAKGLGLLDMGGGRGLWWFADLDTLAFDCVLIFALIHTTRTLLNGRASPTPLFLLVGLTFVALALPLAYTVNNYGTLFRLRQMLYLTAAVAPLTLTARASASRRPSCSSSAPERDR